MAAPSPTKYDVDADSDFSNLYVKFPKIWEDFIDVSWQRQLFDGRKVLKYQLAALGKAYRVERYFAATDSGFRLLGLSPDMEIEVQVRVLVESPSRGPVWCAWATNTATTLKAASVSVASVSSAHIHGRIDWGSALVRDGPSPTHVAVAAQKYQVKVRQKGHVLSSDVCEREFDANVTEFIIEDQEPNAVLEVQARAVSVNGDIGKWCDPVRFLTLCPVELKIAEIGETYAIAGWSRGENDNSHSAEGSIEELVIVVELLPSQRELDVDAQAQKIKVDARSFSNETRVYRIKDLIPGRQYNVRSRYRNVLGDWTEWTVAPLCTLAPVRSPDVQLVGHNFIQVRWQREADESSSYEDSQKDVVEWEVRCATGKASTTMTLPAKENEAKLVNLHPGVDYSIDVRALTTSGEWGLWSNAVAVTTLHRLAPRADFAGETWLKVSWDRKEKRYQDNITRYHIQLNCCNTPFRLAKYFPANVTSYTFENLKPGTKFQLVMQAFSDQRWGPWSEPTEVSTCSPCTAQLIRRGEDFVQIRWSGDYYTRAAVENMDRIYQVQITRPAVDEEDGEHSAPPTIKTMEQVSQATHRVNRLPPYSRVLIQVRCFDYSMQAWCDYGPVTEFRTLPSAVVKTQVGETFVDVSWSRAPRILSAITDEEAENGAEDPLMPEAAKKFVLRLNTVDQHGTHREKSKYHFDDTQPTTFTITELEPDALYSLQLSYEDLSARWSPQSAPIRFRTVPPLKVVILDVGEGFAALQWGRWIEGKTALPVDEANFKIVIRSVTNEDDVPMQCNVQNDTKYVVRNLTPSTVYRIQVAAAPRGGSVWGVWSEPVYICTTPAMETDLELVGEDYAQIVWKRASRESLLECLPNARTRVVCAQDRAVAPPPSDNVDNEGYTVYVGDEAVLEYHFQLHKTIPPPDDDPDGIVDRELFFEAKLHSQQSGVRVPSLTANTPYEALVCASVKSKEWGCWSNALQFRTSMPTEVRIANITQDAVTVRWGKGDEEDDGHIDHDVMKYQLKLDGLDDEYHLEVELDRGVRSYVVKGLSLNACYSCAVRSFLRSDSEWGQWCHAIYIRLQVVGVDLVEASQDWVHLKWPNKVAPDGRPKAQFLSLLGEGIATTTTLGSSECSYIYRDLQPSTLYTAHLLIVEQSPVYVKPQPLAMLQAEGRVVDPSSAAASFSIPLVAADFSQFLSDGFVFRTHRALELNVERVGQNFLLLKWKAKGEEDDEGTSLTNDTFEVEVVEVEGSDKDDGKILRCQGNLMFVRHLRPDSTVRCAVRWVAGRSEVPCQWSNAVVAKLLPMIEPVLGAGDGSDTPGVGEDYLMVHWSRSLRNSNFEGLSGVSFEVRITALEGKDANADSVMEAKQPRFHFTNLQPDTRYQIEIRTLIMHVGLTGEEEVVKGEWSVPLTCTTLSPMAVAVTGVVEAGASVHWRRRNCAVGDAWWEGLEEAQLREEIASISSFHIRVTADETDTLVFDEQFAEHHAEFGHCQTKLKSLKPGGKYSVSVRASTGMLWGAWSAPVTFMTQLPVDVKLPCVGDHFVVSEWQRQEAAVGDGNQNCVMTGRVMHWELSFCTIGREREQRVVTVSKDITRHCVGSLPPNTPHTLCVRPIYKDEETGPWSIPVYFVTLASFDLDIAKVGETFAQVSWERHHQETIKRRMRHKQEDATKDLDEQIQHLLEQIDALENGDDGDGSGADAAVTLDELEDDENTNDAKVDREDVEADPNAAKMTATELKARDIAELREKINEANELREKRKKLAVLQVAELERTATYPKGDDIRYELILCGGGNEDDQEQPFISKKRLGKGELFYRLENLSPKTTYQVTVRSLFSNHYSMDGVSTSDIDDIDEPTGIPWGLWCDRCKFVTLKPITTVPKSIGSECIAVEWDTGSLANETGNSGAAAVIQSEANPSSSTASQGGKAASLRTAITKFQIQVKEPRKPANQQRSEITLEDPGLKGYVVDGLAPNTIYSVSVRVCYEGDKWGVYSAPIHFITMPKLLSKLQSVAERQIEVIVWRDQQLAVPEGQGIIVWKPMITEHQLAINGVECALPFALEQDTSTLLTLDTLAVDTEYTISVKDRVEDHWQQFNDILQCETIPYPPQRPVLQERKGVNVVIAWGHKQNLESRQYVYMVEMALADEAYKLRQKRLQTSPKKQHRDAHHNSGMESANRYGSFQLLGYTVSQEFGMQLHHPIHNCFFRITCCKTNQTIDGEPHPVTVVPGAPQSATIDNPHHYVWSVNSPIAKFKTPSVPDHPTGLQVSNLTHNAATLRWKKPANSSEHSNLVYRVYLNNSYADNFTCVCETENTMCLLTDLVTNCHYRVAVTAESTMGCSVNNNTLHFSTKVTPKQGLAMLRSGTGMKKERLLGSTLPPRAALHAPTSIIEASRAKLASPDEFNVLLDDGASTRAGGTSMSVQMTATVQRSMMSNASTMGGSAAGGMRPNSAGKPRNLPPLDTAPPTPDHSP